ncbi:MAG: two-component regulator propeller domain-containing protein [Rikenellaceae bacterium]
MSQNRFCSIKLCRFHLAVLLSFICYGASAQFNYVDIGGGLSQNSVSAICQDSVGFMWFGTIENGLNRYDGVRFKYFTHSDDDINSIPSNCITALAADSNGNVWIGTNNGLSYYDSSSERLRTSYYQVNGIQYSFSRRTITKIKRCDSGIWYVVASGKVYYKRAEEVMFSPLGELDNLRDVIPLSDNRLLIADGATIEIYDIGAGLSTPLEGLSGDIGRINCIHLAPEGDLYIGTQNRGVGIYNLESGTLQHLNTHNTPTLRSNYIRAFCEDRSGGIYVGSFNGLYLIDARSKEIGAYYSGDNANNALSHNSICDIKCDRTGNIWIATYSGGVNVRYATQYDFVSYSRNVDKMHSLKSNVINTFYEDSYGVWIGTDGAGVALYNNGEIRHIKPNCLQLSIPAGSHAKSMFKASQGRLWIGYHGAGLSLFNQDRMVDEMHFLGYTNVYSIARGSDGLLWLACPGSGVILFDERSLSSVQSTVLDRPELINAKYLHYSEKQNIMWVCTTENIFYYNFRLGKLSSLKGYTPPIYSQDNIHHLSEDSQGNTWVASTNGLVQISSLDVESGACQIKTFNIASSLPDNNIMALLEDDCNNIWASTLYSIIRLDPSTEEIKIYNHDYNIQPNDFLKASAFRSKDGRLWFGGNGGFTIFSPSAIDSNSFIPELYITDININNGAISPHDQTDILQQAIINSSQITLAHWQNNIRLTATAFNYIFANRNSYRWELLKRDKIYLSGATPDILLMNLTPGRYKLRVWASNNDDIWNPSCRELSLEVQYPWYLRGYAVIIYILITVILVYITRRITVERAATRNKIQLIEIQRATNEKLYNQKVQFFTNISHEIKTPLSLILGPLLHLNSEALSHEIKSHLSVAIRNAKYLNKLVDELLDFRRREQYTGKLQLSCIEVDRLIRSISDLFEESLSYEYTPVRYHCEIPEKCMGYLDPIIVEKMLLNLLYNAFKYNVAQNPITITLSGEYPAIDEGYDHYSVGAIAESVVQTVVISVNDSGSGIAKENLPKIFRGYFQIANLTAKNNGFGLGLAFVKQLTLTHCAELRVCSRLGCGSTFSIKIPVAREDYDAEQIKEEARATESTPRLSPKPQEPQNHKYTVLLVEDNVELQEWVRRCLSDHYNCIVASNGVEGYAKAIEQRPQVIISDVMMPDMDGYELCAKVKSDLATSHIPVILLTAKSTDQDALMGYKLGANAYITKPFDLETLLYQIENLIELRGKIIENYSANTEESSREFIDTLPQLDREFMESVYTYIDENISLPELSVDSLAAALLIGRTSLYRKVKSLTGTTPNELIKDHRLKRAYSLIEENKMPLVEIAESVGINDVYYFKRCFKQKYNIKLK